MSTPPPCLQSEPRAHLRIRLDAPAPMRLWHLTSLDAPTVAVVWTLAFAWGAHVRLPLWLPVVLALAAWTVYIIDRLLDARNARTPLRARHHFHWRHRRFFVPIALLAAVAAIVLVLRSMPFAARERNSVLAAAALAYFTSVHSPWRIPAPKLRLRLPKELIVGILFTVACAAPAWTRIPAHPLVLLPAVVVFTALAWLNCHAIEVWESQSPQRFAVLRVAAALAIFALLAAVLAAALHNPRPAALLGVAAFSAALLAMLDHRRQRLTPIALRAAADFVLLTPIALLVIPK